MQAKASTYLIFIFLLLVPSSNFVRNCNGKRESHVCVVARAPIKFVPDIIVHRYFRKVPLTCSASKLHGAWRDHSLSLSSRILFFSRRSSEVIEGLLYWRPTSTGLEAYPRTCLLEPILKTQAAETRASKIRTHLTTNLRALHIKENNKQ